MTSLSAVPAMLRRLATARNGELDRASERERRVLLTAGASAAARVTTAAAGLISVPLTVAYLGAERYGLWMAISSVITMLAFADLGLGNGLLNAVSAASGRGDRAAVRQAVSSVFYVLSTIAAVVAGAAALLYAVLPWPRIFNVTSYPAVVEAGPTALVLALCFAANLPLGIVERVQSGYQEGFLNHAWQCAAALLSILAILAAIHLNAGLPWLVAAFAGTPVAVRLANWLVQFLCARPWLLPRTACFDFRAAAKLSRTGVLFLSINLLIMLGYLSDSLIITQILGPAAVAQYAVAQKLFVATHISEFLIAPLWPAFGEAMAVNDHGWIRRTIRRSLFINFGITLATSIPLVLWGRQLIGFWTSSAIAVDLALLLSFAAWRLLSVYQGTMSVFLNNGDLLRRQLKIFAAASFASFALKFVLARPLGPAGVVAATVIGFGIFYVQPAGKLAFAHLRFMERAGAPQRMEAGNR